MNCHYCHYPIEDEDAWVTIGAGRYLSGLSLSKVGHLSCALANVRTIRAQPDTSGRWCSFHHAPTGRWCMSKPGHDGDHDLE